MCGIAGVVNDVTIDLNKLALALKHRGPDAQTIYTHQQVALIHTRLAIQDIALGNQPFHFEHLSIVFNGEIYNHQHLRQQYLSEFSFTTNSDTETLLYLFIKYQEKMFDHIDGMFAFCIYDRYAQKMFFARDRAGKKPLYYYSNTHSFLFASELNAIKAVKDLTIASEAIQSYLRTGLIWHRHTPYKEIQELPAGCYLMLDINTQQTKIIQYFNMVEQYNKPAISISLAETLQQLDTHLTNSVHDRIQASDVEVGVFLSGGIDSNLIAAIAAQSKSNLKTFTIKFNGLYDESPLAKLTAQKYHTNHIELPISPTLTQDIETILTNYGEPFMDSSAIPSYYVSKAARQYVKVVLGGDGADELFGGYRRYVPIKHGINKYIKWLNPIRRLLPKPQLKQSKYNYLYRLLAMSNKQDLDFYLAATTDVFEDAHPISQNEITDELNAFIQSILYTNMSPLKKMLALDFNIILFADLLVKMDIASMANALEVRSPFLSKHMLEFAPSLPDSFKIHGWQTKYILRQLAKKYLPPMLISQPKRGFEVPLKKWVEEDLKEPIYDNLTNNSYAKHYIDPLFIQRLLNRQLAISPEKRAKILWSLYCLEVWHRNETRYHFSS